MKRHAGDRSPSLTSSFSFPPIFYSSIYESFCAQFLFSGLMLMPAFASVSSYVCLHSSLTPSSLLNLFSSKLCNALLNTIPVKLSLSFFCLSLLSCLLSLLLILHFIFRQGLCFKERGNSEKEWERGGRKGQGVLIGVPEASGMEGRGRRGKGGPDSGAP